MIWTFGGTEFTPGLSEMIEKYQLGALIAFSRNIKNNEQIARFNEKAQTLARGKLKAPLFLMVDQEGGTVTRIKVRTPLPSALAVGNMKEPSFVEDYAKVNGELLASLGFNVNLSPVMDVSDPRTNSFIANRVFGAQAIEVSEVAMAYANGLAQAGLIPTAKHFPGHGGMVNDSHLKAAKKLATLEELEKSDLIPFLNFINNGPSPKALMMAHMALPNIDESGMPATYSTKLIQDILRGKFGYNGLIITDDLEMGGASVSPDLGERAVRAFLAGNDMVMLAGLPRNQRRAFDAMVAAVKSGRIPQERLDESVGRILAAKSQLATERFKFEKKRDREIKTKLEALSREIMQKNFKEALKSKTSMWPNSPRTLVLSSDRRFYAHFRDQYTGKASYRPLTPETLPETADLIAQEAYGLVIYYASGSVTAKWLTKLPFEQRAKVIVVNCNNPGKLRDTGGFLSVLHINSHSPESGAWIARELNSPPTPELQVPAQEKLAKRKARRPRKS